MKKLRISLLPHPVSPVWDMTLIQVLPFQYSIWKSLTMSFDGVAFARRSTVSGVTGAAKSYSIHDGTADPPAVAHLDELLPSKAFGAKNDPENVLDALALPPA